jgi:hypothetical protein
MQVHTHLHTCYHTACDACEYAIRFVRKYLCECVQVKIFMCVYADITFNHATMQYAHIYTHTYMYASHTASRHRADVLCVAYIVCVLCVSVRRFFSHTCVTAACHQVHEHACVCDCFCTCGVCLHVCIYMYIQMYMLIRTCVSNHMYTHTPLQQAHTAPHPPHIIICPADTPHTHSHS